MHKRIIPTLQGLVRILITFATYMLINVCDMLVRRLQTIKHWTSTTHLNRNFEQLYNAKNLTAAAREAMILLFYNKGKDAYRFVAKY